MDYTVIYKYKDNVYTQEMSNYISTKSEDFALCVAEAISHSMRNRMLFDKKEIKKIIVQTNGQNLCELDPKEVFKITE